MVGVAVGNEGVRKGWRVVGMIGELEIHSPFEVSEDVFNSLPMTSTRVSVELCEYAMSGQVLIVRYMRVPTAFM